MTIEGKKLLVVGLGATGLAVARAGSALGARILAYDDREQARDRAAEELAGLGLSMITSEEAAHLQFDLCVASPGIPPSNHLLRTLEARGLPVISEIELAWLISKAPIAAVTGTNGKSTTTVLAGKMIEASGRRTFIGGNLSAEGYDLPLITAAAQAEPEDVLVAEVSSFQLERCYRFRPRAAALLNITPDHQDRYTSLDGYAEAKMRIFQAQEPPDTAVLGWDDPVVRRLGDRLGSRKLWFSSQEELSEGAYLRGEELILRIEGCEERIALAREMRMWTSFDRLNTLAAACIALAMNAPVEAIHSAAISFAGLPHRMEDCGSIDGVRWFNNSMCTNPAAGSAAVREVASAFPAIVIAGGAGKGLDYGAWGSEISRSATALILIGQDSDVLARAAEQAGMKDIHRAPSLRLAMELARSIARPGDAVVLAPAMASFGEFTDFRDRGRKFKEICESFCTEASSV